MDSKFCIFTKKFTFNKTHTDKGKGELVFPDAVDTKLKQKYFSPNSNLTSWEDQFDMLMQVLR